MRIGAWCAPLCLAGALLGTWIGAARAGGAADSTGNLPAWLSEIQCNALLSVSYSYNFNRPPSRTNQFRVFDFDDNTFKLDEFALVVQKPAAKPRDGGFRVDLAVGSSIPPVTASAGLFRDDSGQAEDIDLHQAFATYLAPVGSGLRVDAGKFVTPFGYEVIDGYDRWNDNATRGVVFGYAGPFAHVGVRSSYVFSPHVSVLAMLVNGWDVAVDNNRGKSVGAQVTVTPSSRATISVGGMFGPERADNNSDPRTLLDVIAIFRTSSRVTLGGNFDWGSDQDALGPGLDGRWSGFAGYTRLSMTGAFAVSLRGEYFNDRDGIRTGVVQELTEFTVTPELRLSPRMLLRGDARVDHSNYTQASPPAYVFERAKGSADTQPTAFIQAIYSF